MEELECVQKTFLNLSHEELLSERKVRKEDYDNLSTASLCCSVITQTLQQLQNIKVLQIYIFHSKTSKYLSIIYYF